MVVFLNGKYVPADQARVGIMTHALAYGTGVFEGIRGYWNEQREDVFIFRAREHFERLHRSCRIMQIDLPFTVDELVEAAAELVRRNGQRENIYIRPFAYKSDEIIGVKLHGLRDHFAMYSWPQGDYVGTDGLRCGVSSWRRVDDNMIPARAKVAGAYVNSALAKTEAQQNGFDEAIMLTSEGHVSEGSAENLFMVINGELITPPTSENILPGITRDTVIHLAHRELGRITRERVIDRTELYGADEIFLTGTGAQIAPVVAVDHRPVGKVKITPDSTEKFGPTVRGEIGPISREIQHIYNEVVRGMRPDYSSWCLGAHSSAKRPATVSARHTTNGQASNGHAESNGANGTNGHKSNGHTPARGRGGAEKATPGV
jgi:branched-chain amino acid aminotransferase